MKSGREHSTPDKAMWGISCTVRPQESADVSPTGLLPFMTNLYLSLASVCCSLIGQLYSGPPPSWEEEQCQDLLNSELLQHCVWPLEGNPVDELVLNEDTYPPISPPQHTPLPLKVIQQLRNLVGKPRPTLRPSTQELLQPHDLEDLIVSVCLKQYGCGSPLQILGCMEDTAEMENWKDFLEVIFSRINSLERRLQLLAELERRWWTDVEDIVANTLSPNSEAFFYDLLHHEGSQKSLEFLCCLKDVTLNQNDILSTARELQDKMEVDVERWKGGGEGEGKTKIEETIDKTPVVSTAI